MNTDHVVVRGRVPFERTRAPFESHTNAGGFAADFSDDRTIICAVTAFGPSAYIENA